MYARRRLFAALARPSSSPSYISGTGSSDLPSFLVPAFSPQTRRQFSATAPCSSKIGALPLHVPSDVTLSVVDGGQNGRTGARRKWAGKKSAKGAIDIGLSKPIGEKIADVQTVLLQGPMGEISMPIPSFVNLRTTPDKKLFVSVIEPQNREQRTMWGTVRSYLQNHITGVSAGHTAILRLNGVGYRATIEPTASTVTATYPGQLFVNLKVGFSHPVELGVPEGVKASTPQPTRLLLEGIDKHQVMQFAANLRKWRPPEPYKGKGIFVNGETIKLKNKKIS
ncbi:ribosomal protein L6, alpha-beta domain-containing protein [Lineolata rhizophorae]|uniref:Ribosomal protein L6, alpha-beta domain-containing protein n=1 Tax=Lineolata rhizophorae TaxID=578093 RepID=A0A6A6NME9_9PEZI|nr:ribosomal protein L6, alpha-beta domain-containing protein [Lineolata rhizophorae]